MPNAVCVSHKLQHFVVWLSRKFFEFEANAFGRQFVWGCLKKYCPSEGVVWQSLGSFITELDNVTLRQI